MHTGASGDPHPPSEPFGMLLPPVRRAFPTGATHQARLVAGARSPGGAAADDPVTQVLADERAAGGTHRGAGVAIHRFDLGHIAAGTLRLDVGGAAPGTVLDVAAAEHLDGEGRLVTLGQHAGVRYTCAGGQDERFESLRRPRHPAPARVGPGAAGGPGAHGRPVDRTTATGPGHRARPSSAPTRSCSASSRSASAPSTSAPSTPTSTAPPGSSGPGPATRWCTRWSTWSPTPTGRWPGGTRSWRPAPGADGMLAMAPASDFAADDRTFVPDWALHWVRVGAQPVPLHRRPGAGGRPAPGGRARRCGGSSRTWPTTGCSTTCRAGCCSTGRASTSRGCSSTLNALWARALEDLAEMARWLGNDGTAGGRWPGARRWPRPSRRSGTSDAGRVRRPRGRRRGGARRRPARGRGGARRGPRAGRRASRAVIDRLTDRSRLIRHSWVMDTVTPSGDSGGLRAPGDGVPRADLGRRAADGRGRALLPLRAARRAGPRRPRRPGGRAVPGLVGVPRGRRDHVARVLDRRHPVPRLVVHPHPGPHRAHPGDQPRPSRATPRCGCAPASGTSEWARATVPTPHGPVTVEADAGGRVEVDAPVPVVRD